MDRRFTLLAVVVSLLGGCASRRAASRPAPADPGPLVLIVDADRGDAINTTGVVTHGGVIASAPSRPTRRVQVITSDGRRFDSPGVIDYRSNGYEVLLLIDVAWEGTGPRPISLAPTCPDPEQSVRTPLATWEEGRFSVVEYNAKRTWTLAGPTNFECSPVERPYKPGPVLDEGGRLVGMVSGWQVGVKFFPLGSTAGLRAWRPEVIGTLTRRALVSWDEWASRVEPDVRAAFEKINAAKGSFDEQIAACQEATRLDPLCASAWRSLGLIYYRESKYALAEPALSQALLLVPTDSECLMWKAWCAMKLGRLDPALKDSERAVALNPANANNHGRRGYILNTAQRYAEAAAAYAEAVRLNPKDEFSQSELRRLQRSLSPARPSDVCPPT